MKTFLTMAAASFIGAWAAIALMKTPAVNPQVHLQDIVPDTQEDKGAQWNGRAQGEIVKDPGALRVVHHATMEGLEQFGVQGVILNASNVPLVVEGVVMRILLANERQVAKCRTGELGRLEPGQKVAFTVVCQDTDADLGEGVDYLLAVEGRHIIDHQILKK